MRPVNWRRGAGRAPEGDFRQRALLDGRRFAHPPTSPAGEGAGGDPRGDGRTGMIEQEIARTGAAYKAEVIRLFGFLVTEYGCAPPIDADGQYRHGLAYRCPARNTTIVFHNAYHPVDYGFEISLYPGDGPWRAADRDMLFFVLKADQDPGLGFHEAGVPALRTALDDISSG